MGVFFRCDGCGGEIPEPAMEGRHALGGDGVPPPRFEWCRLCSRAAFEAVAARGGRRALPAGPAGDGGVRFVQGRAAAGGDETREVPGVQQVTRWMPRSDRRGPSTGG